MLRPLLFFAPRRAVISPAPYSRLLACPRPERPHRPSNGFTELLQGTLQIPRVRVDLCGLCGVHSPLHFKAPGDGNGSVLLSGPRARCWQGSTRGRKVPHPRGSASLVFCAPRRAVHFSRAVFPLWGLPASWAPSMALERLHSPYSSRLIDSARARRDVRYRLRYSLRSEFRLIGRSRIGG